MKRINLDALDTARHSVEKGGRAYDVKPVTPRIAFLLDAAGEADGPAKLTAYCDAVAALLPGMPRADVEDLTIAQIHAIVQLAGTQVDVVEEAIGAPNGSGSALTAPATEPSLAAI